MKRVFKTFESIFDCSEAVYNNTTVIIFFKVVDKMYLLIESQTVCCIKV